MRTLTGAAALGLALALAACSPAAEKPAATPAETPAAAPAEPVAETPAPAPVTEVAEAPVADPATPAVDSPAAPPAAVTATKVVLDAKDATGAQLTGDTAAGQAVFKKCAQCHSPLEGKNGTGPSLYGIVGRPSGSIAGFRYSEANRTSGITWTEQEMFNYLENPKKRIPGTIMAFVGLKKPQERADVIAYLKVNAQQ